MMLRSIVIRLTSTAATVGLLATTASAQSGSRTTYPQNTYPRGQVVQGSTTQRSMTQGSTTQPKETFESKFWRFLQDARFREWAPVAGTTGDVYEGQSPHGEMLKMYLNRRAAGWPNELPPGSVIVKENYGSDGKTLMAITTMYRPKNYSGWYWTKYNPDGSVATKDGTRLAGKVQGCIDCHSGAAGGDSVFFND